METIVLGAGCFWCTEAVFSRLKGVLKVMPGYSGGTTENPTYHEVCSGRTGHAEVAEIEYDPKVLKLEKLFDLFFSVHDATSLNRQGEDVGSQYRSAIFCTSKEQKKKAEEFIRKIQKDYEKPIVTEVKMLDKFYSAEDYHKQFYEKNHYHPYCLVVIGPKLAKVKEKLEEK